MTIVAATESRTSSVAPGRILKIGAWSVMAVLAVLVFLYAGRYLTLNPLVYLENQRDVYIANVIPLTMHVAGAMAAMLIGPFQFLPRMITRRYVRIHRMLGRIYLVGVLVGGLGGLYMAFLAFGGFPAKLGFATLACVWLFCGAVAFQRIRARQIQSHRAWMVRTFALTFAAVTLRLWMVVFQIAGLDYIESYITVAWLSWVPNLVVAEWIVHRITRNTADARLGHGASTASA